MTRRREVAAPGEATPMSPAARRTTAPRWFDLRLLIGLTLVIASVVVGAKIISAADRTVSVWAVTRDLAAGTTLTDNDVTTVDVRLDSHAGSYLAASTNPVGRTLQRDVGKGDLLPTKSVAAHDGLVSLALSVPASRVPVTVQRGDRITIYATAAPAASASEPTGAATATVAEAVTVAEVSARSQGALSVGSGELQVVIKVPSCAVTAILNGTVDQVLTVVEVPSGTPAATSC